MLKSFQYCQNSSGVFFLKSLRAVKAIFVFGYMLCISSVEATELYIGKATADITPKLPVALMGQFELRIANKAETPLSANVIALESRDGSQQVGATIMVSCDLVFIPADYLQKVRAEVSRRLPGFDVNN